MGNLKGTDEALRYAEFYEWTIQLDGDIKL